MSHPEKGSSVKQLGPSTRTSPLRSTPSKIAAGFRSWAGRGVPGRLLVLLGALVLLAAVVASAAADGRIGAPGAGAGQVGSLAGVGVSQAEGGDLYVGDNDNRRIDQFTSGGEFVRAFGWGVDASSPEEELQVCTGATGCQGGVSGSGAGQFSRIRDVAVDNDPASPSYGDVYVADGDNFRIQKFSAEGEFLWMAGGAVDKGPHHPGNLCTAAYIAEGDECGRGAPNAGPGSFVSFETTSGCAFSGFPSWCHEESSAIAVGPDGTVYVGDYGRVQKFEPSGSYIGEVAVPSAQFPNSLALDEAGHIYANETAHDERQAVTPPASGTYTLTFEGQSTPPLAFDEPAFDVGQALEALPTINTKVKAGLEINSKLEIVFEGKLSDQDLPLISTSAGSVSTIADGTPGKLMKLSPSGEILETLDATGEPTHVALDQEGNVFVSEFRSSQAGSPVGAIFEVPAQFLAYKPNGTLFAEFTSDQVVNEEERRASNEYARVSANPTGFALGSGKVFAASTRPEGSHVAVVPLPQPGPPVVKKQSATDIEATTATLRATLNAEGYDTHYRFEYISDKAFEENVEHGEPGYTGATETAEGDIGIVIRDTQVAVAVSPLQPETGYHFRAIAENTEGTAVGADQQFETLPPLSVRDVTTQTVGPELVALKAELNPNNGSGPESSGGTYTFEFGKDQSYKGGKAEGTLEIGNEFQPVSATFTGLEPNTEYHYQLVASSSNGAIETADGIFTTELSTAEERALENCPNTNFREQDNALALPDCRDYEQVTPREKRGYAVLSQFTSPSGERVAFESLGAFTGSLDGLNYVAERTPEGWVSRPAAARAAGPEFQPKAFVEGFTAEYETSLFPLVKASTAQEAEEATAPNVFYMGRADGSFAQASPVLSPLSGARPHGGGWDKVIAASSDMSKLFVLTRFRLLPEDPLGDGPGAENRIYEITNGGLVPTVKLAAEVPAGLGGQSSCGIDSSFERGLNSTSEDGSVLVYDAPVEAVPGAKCDAAEPGPNKAAVYAQVEGGQPVELSTPPASQCQSPSPCATAALQDAHFAGMSADGSLVWFTTTQPLVNGDSDKSNDLYLARLENGEVAELVQASADQVGGEAADVQGLFGVAHDGKRAAFVARAVLTEEPNGVGDQAEAGADNLYAYDLESGETKFVARLCSAPSTSGSVTDAACPAFATGDAIRPADHQLWDFGDGGSRQRQITPDGAFLLFQSVGRLTPDDTDNAGDIYRYDFETEQLNRLSFGRRGNDGNGNDDAYEAEIQIEHSGLGNRLDAAAGDMSRSISSNGAVAVFMTAAPLVSHDTNAGSEPSCASKGSGCDTYEWEEQGHGTCTEPGGCISLISSGVDPHNSIGLIGASGRDITFLSPRAFVPGDEDGVVDVFDARVDGGFRFTPPPPPCGGLEACRPQPGSQPPLPKITTENDTGGNGPHTIKCAKGRHRATKHGQVRCVPNKKHHRKKHRHRSHNKSGGK